MRYDPERNVLIYENVPDVGAILSRCEGAAHVGPYVIVPAVLGNLQQLRRLELPINTPMDRDYEWPICAAYGKPTLVQRITANFLVTHPWSFCLNDMGTMKTLSSLWAMDYLMRKHPGMKAIVSAPLSILKDTWENEQLRNFLDIRRTRKDGLRTVAILHGSAQQRLRELQRDDVDLYIVNTDGLSVGARDAGRGKGVILDGFSRALFERRDIGLWVFDEVSAYRDPSTKRHKVARALLQNRPYFWAMTGSPTPNGPMDAYGLAKLVNNAYGESRTSYQGRTMRKLSTFSWKPAAGWKQAVEKLLMPAVRFSIEDCVDLPPMVNMPIRNAPLSDQQEGLYKQFAEECVASINGQDIMAVNEGALRWKLLQVVTGAIYDAHHTAHFVDAAPRMRVLKEALAEVDGKAIIFSPLTSVLHLLVKELGKDAKVAYINGEVKPTERAAIFEWFRDKSNSLRYLIADPASMAHGLNLTCAIATVWYAPIDKSEVYIQALKRIHRPGQTAVTRNIRIAATEEERRMYSRLESGKTMNGVILDLVNERRHR